MNNVSISRIKVYIQICNFLNLEPLIIWESTDYYHKRKNITTKIDKEENNKIIKLNKLKKGITHS